MFRNLLYKIASTIRPDLKLLDERRRLLGSGDVLTTLYSAPLIVVGVFWLYRESYLDVIQQEWEMLLAVAILIWIFSRFNFYMIFEINPGRYANSESSLDGMVVWSGLFLFGPIILWLPLVKDIIIFGNELRKTSNVSQRWGVVRVFAISVATDLLPPLIALLVYQRVGGKIPIEGLQVQNLFYAMGALLVNLLFYVLIMSLYLIYTVWTQGLQAGSVSIKPTVFFIFQAIGLPYLAMPFGIFASGIYVLNGMFSYLFFIFGWVLVAFIARRLSKIAENSRQQTRQLEKLEQLGRDILSGSLDASMLSEILAENVPTMFPSTRIIIWIAPDLFLLRRPDNWYPGVDDFWEWVQVQDGPKAFLSGGTIPWRENSVAPNSLVVLPILHVESNEPIGCIYLELLSIVQSWDNRMLSGLFPAVRALGAQVASALHQADVYAESLALQQSHQELRLAGEIQASFFPDEIPELPGWELAVTILPARETSGDFFDFIPLEDGRLGILIADVMDKGVGPALYMALSRTLIRTYAIEYEADPDVVFFAANERILQDARANLFVTAFYGILDPVEGTLIYSNAGHNPPYLVRNNGQGTDDLRPTGIPIGLDSDTVWQTATIKIEPGDALLLYTDGIPDSINGEGDFFDDEKLLAVARTNLNNSALGLQASIIEDLHAFTGEAPQVDDITLMVLKHNSIE